MGFINQLITGGHHPAASHVWLLEGMHQILWTILVSSRKISNWMIIPLGLHFQMAVIGHGWVTPGHEPFSFSHAQWQYKLYKTSSNGWWCLIRVKLMCIIQTGATVPHVLTPFFSGTARLSVVTMSINFKDIFCHIVHAPKMFGYKVGYLPQSYTHHF